MRRTVALLLIALFLLPAAVSENAFTVNGQPVSEAEARIYLMNAESSYGDIVAYYRDFLGIDYWSLTTANGMTAAEAVKSDVFRELVMLNVFYAMALDEGVSLTDTEKTACATEAKAYYASLPLSSASALTEADVEDVMRKQRLADRMYSMLLGEIEIDEDAVVASVDPALYRAYDVEYLLSPAGNEQTEEEIERLRDEESWAGLTDESVIYGTARISSADESADRSLLNAASLLEIGETSGIIKTDYGLFIIRMTDSLDPSAYEDALESALYEARRNAFQADYNALYSDAEYEINVSFWDSVTIGE